jgi:uncharacterized membrane protein
VDRMLVVVFDTENKAYEGKKGLAQLDNQGSITLYAEAVIAKNADGTVTVKQHDTGPLGTLAGTALGSVIGLLAGPAGLAIGASVGFVGGLAADLNNARVGDDFIDDAAKHLLPNKFAVVAEVDEDWTIPVDRCMETIGGTVFRRALKEVKHTIHEENVAAMRADMAQIQAEQATAQADRKAKLLEKMNELDSKMQAQLEKDKQQRNATALQAKAKAEMLKEKAAALKAKAAEVHN